MAADDDYRPRHWTLIREALIELRARLEKRDQPLVVRHGEMPDTLETLRRNGGPLHLWAHEETGNARTYDRDRRVRAWADQQGVPFTEIPSRGVVRGPHDRNDWADQWEAAMRRPLVHLPDTLTPVEGIEPGPMPTHADLGLGPCTAALQRIGEAEAHRTLNAFLRERGRSYRRAMSSPLTGQTACSRMSVHLAYGTISLGRVIYELRERRAELEGRRDPAATRWRKALDSSDSRLHWHSHFTQKLEDAPRIEHESYIPAFDRLRAMLCSFAAYDCWLDWRRFAPVYGGLMADYVSGIHYPQTQMQSGTTGINQIRVYNPVKQGQGARPGRHLHPPLGARIGAPGDRRVRP